MILTNVSIPSCYNFRKFLFCLKFTFKHVIFRKSNNVNIHTPIINPNFSLPTTIEFFLTSSLCFSDDYSLRHINPYPFTITPFYSIYSISSLSYPKFQLARIPFHYRQLQYLDLI